MLFRDGLISGLRKRCRALAVENARLQDLCLDHLRKFNEAHRREGDLQFRNQRLYDELNELEIQLEEAGRRNSRLSGEFDQLAAENDALRRELAGD